jgi:hypothetical protein
VVLSAVVPSTNTEYCSLLAGRRTCIHLHEISGVGGDIRVHAKMRVMVSPPQAMILKRSTFPLLGVSETSLAHAYQSYQRLLNIQTDGMTQSRSWPIEVMMRRQALALAIGKLFLLTRTWADPLRHFGDRRRPFAWLHCGLQKSFSFNIGVSSKVSNSLGVLPRCIRFTVAWRVHATVRRRPVLSRTKKICITLFFSKHHRVARLSGPQ